MRYRVRHTTTYVYDDAVSICHNEVRLTPRSTPHQRCLRTLLTVDPPPPALHSQLDYFGNPATFFILEEPHHEMAVCAESEITLSPGPPVDPVLTPPWESVRDGLPRDRSAAGLLAYSFRFDSPHVPCDPALAAYAAPSFTAQRPILDAALDLTRRIHRDFRYRPGVTSVATSVLEVLAERHGVCQDFAHLELACLRSLGLAARYVSGYVRTTRSPVRERLVGADASHAWIAVWCGEAGWVELDPTNDRIPSDEHVVLAWGRDYADVSPMRGVILGGGASHQVDVAVDVTPL